MSDYCFRFDKEIMGIGVGAGAFDYPDGTITLMFQEDPLKEGSETVSIHLTRSLAKNLWNQLTLIFTGAVGEEAHGTQVEWDNLDAYIANLNEESGNE